MKFHYKAERADGSFYEGDRDAADKFGLYHELKRGGETLIAAQEAKRRGPDLAERFGALFRSVSMHERIVFARNLGAMLEAGLPLARSLAVLERQTRNKKLQGILGELGASIKRGRSLHEALAAFPDVFAPLFVSMVKAGEESGTLGAALKSVGAHLESVYALGRKIKSALVYPTIVIGLLAVIGILMLIFVVPSLTAAFKEFKVTLPLSTRAVIFVSDFLKNNIVVSLSAIVLAVVGAAGFVRTRRGKRAFDWLVLRLPLISPLVRETNTARTARTLSSLLSAGVDILVAIDIAIDVVQNSYYRRVLSEGRAQVAKGVPLSKIFVGAEPLYPPLLGEMAAVGEETGKLSEMLQGVGFFYEGEVDQKTKDLSTVVEPFLMIFIGVVVGFFAIAMITPAYSLVNSI